MKKISIYFFSWLICYAFVIQAKAEARTEMYYFSGGGEPLSKDSTQFDPELDLLSDVQKSRNIELDIYFNGGHKSSEANLKNLFPTKSQALTVSNFKNAINDLGTSVSTLSKDDQVVIYISSHGDARNYDSQQSHSISCGPGEKAPRCNLDDLSKTIDKLNAKGVKVAIIDMSCYSGSSIESLKRKNVCVISATKKDSVGYAQTSRDLLSEIKNGGSLEDIYLRARKKFPNQAQISSQAGVTTKEYLDLLFYRTKNPQPISESATGFCSLKGDWRADLKEFKSRLLNEKNINVDTSALEKAYLNHEKLLAEAAQLEKETSALDSNIFNNTSWMMLKVPTENLKMEIAKTQESLNSTHTKRFKEDDKENLKAKLEHLSGLLNSQKQLLNQNSDFKKYYDKAQKHRLLTFANTNTFLDGSLMNSLGDILKEETKVYDQIYNKLKSKDDVCANIHF